ncbi:MAG: hypothetical protein LBJ64_13040 [Deltaproteobacteria bacterium]|jgi:type IV pilus assembly protein PilY1|nr:hypothetical protein [Deltaproteobacteria bacterium]
MIVLSKDIKMFQQAYPGLTDIDGDGRMDTGFNPGVEYVGYFDSRSCYAYRGQTQSGLYGNFMTGDVDGLFFRVGSTIEDQSEAEINRSRPAGLKNYVRSPRSATGVCSDLSQSVSHMGSGTFSGNWLNYLTASRMDALTKILYGGRRSEDSLTRTVLEMSFVPPDSTVWGTEVRSDDTWMEVTPLAVWYNLRKYSPFDPPSSGKGHFFARSSDLGQSNRYFPALKVLLNVERNDFDLGANDSVNEPIAVSDPQPRYWDWVLVNRPLPDDKVLKADVRKRILVYNLHVEVCNPNNLSPTEGCLKYPGPTASPQDDVHKPVGLLQRYGSGAIPMHFGLVTGGYNNDVRKQGGKLRNHVGPVEGRPPRTTSEYVPAIDSLTGQVIPNGLVKNIDNLRIAGRPIDKDPTSWDGERYYNTYSWGNPVGEMFYEAVRYFGGATTPTGSYNYQADHDERGSSILQLTSFSGNWNARKPTAVDSSCSKPIILLMTDFVPEHDGDSFNTDIVRPLLPKIVPPQGLTESRDLPSRFNLQTYLNTISKLEGISSSREYVVAKNARDSCSAKTINSLYEIKGICPTSPAYEGTYSLAAAAYYAHIRNFNLTQGASQFPNSVDLYAVTMSSPFPSLEFDVEDKISGERVDVSILPASIISHSSGSGKIMSFLNYFILEWETDKLGQTFHATIKVNFSDAAMGDDWEGDAQVTYEVDLLTDASTPASMRETAPVVFDSGEAHLKQGVWHKFKNPASADAVGDFIEIKPNQVKAILVKSSWEVKGTGQGMAMGYTIQGTARDGAYMDVTMNRPPASSFLTPTGCQYVGGSTAGTNGCTKIVQDLKKQSRVFAVRANSQKAEELPNPLWLAAKYGGFTDANNNGAPDPGEWEGPDGAPKNYFQTTTIAQLPDKLEATFKNINSAVSAGSATSASVASHMGGGLSVQSYYYPLYANPIDPGQMVRWTGGVYGLFIDRFGNLREDGDGDLTLTTRYDPKTSTGDEVVTMTSPDADNPPVCWTPGKIFSRCRDVSGFNDLTPAPGAAAAPEDLHQLKPVFDVARWLSSLPEARLRSGSRPFTQAATVADGRRLVYYGQPLPGGGTKLSLFDVQNAAADLEPLMLGRHFEEILPHQGTVSRRRATEMLIEYVLGLDQPGWRSRAVGNPWTNRKDIVTWRHGDVLNSKPVVVGAPAFDFDLLYGDKSYATFKKDMAGRRQMLYYGSNDGLLHAVNLGFPDYAADGRISYDLSQNNAKTAHDMGAELWAYVPSSALPHLQWLADPDYVHAYYVDMKPMVADVQIRGQWRTLLLAGLRLGGRPIEAAAKNNVQGDHYFSEIFALDVTDPEKPPELLWRYSSLELGLSVGLPTVVASGGKWYAVLPSGPVTDATEYKSGLPAVKYGAKNPQDGYSVQRAKLIVLDVETGLPAVNTDPAKGGNVNYLRAPENNSFFNEPFVPAAQIKAVPWNNHAVYYGLTVSRQGGDNLDRGAVYRLQMVDAQGAPLPVARWALKRLFNVDKPVSGAVNSAYDSRGQLWVVFGTGRLWSFEDVSPCPGTGGTVCRNNHQQYLYGLKEPLNNGLMTFADRTGEAGRIKDMSGVTVYKDGTAKGVPGAWNGTDSYANVKNSILAANSVGYRRKLDMGAVLDPGGQHQYEMIVTQPKIVQLGNGDSLMAFTSFEPAVAQCGAIGVGYQYAVDAFTGLPAPDFSRFFVNNSSKYPHIPQDMVVGAISAGVGRPTEATIIRTEGKLIIRSANSDGGLNDIEIAAPDIVPGSGLISWREVLNPGLELSPSDMTEELENAF